MVQLKRPETLTAAVVGYVRDAILAGVYPPGSALPEMQIAAVIGTSRGTVREALRALQEKGMVEVIAHRGAFVPELSARKAGELVTLRGLLESYAVRLAVLNRAWNAGQPARTALLAAFENLVAVVHKGTAADLVEADMNFHRELALASGHTMLVQQLLSLQAQTRQFMVQTQLFQADPASEVTTHQELINELFSGDANRAATAVQEHIVGSGERLLERMSIMGIADSPVVSLRLSTRTAAAGGIG